MSKIFIIAAIIEIDEPEEPIQPQEQSPVPKPAPFSQNSLLQRILGEISEKKYTQAVLKFMELDTQA
jgi:hypothetical protein